MNEYHKIQTLFKRDMERNGKTLLEGQWTLPEFEFLAGNTWVFTEKVDGTNIRVMLKDGAVTFGGKTDSAQIPAQLVARLNDRFLPLASKMQEVFGCDACLYGEGYGAKIQKGGGNYRSDQDFVLFDVNVGGWWLQRADVEDVAQKLGLDVVPIIGEGTLHDAIAAVKAGITSTWGDFQAEGIVARPKTELKTRNGHRIITKIKCRDFVGPNVALSRHARQRSDNMNEPVSREVGSNAGLGAVLTYRSAGRSGVHGMTLGAAGEGDFAVLFTGNPADAEFAAAEYLRRLVKGGWRITASMIVPNEPRFTGESIRTVAAPLPTVGG